MAMAQNQPVEQTDPTAATVVVERLQAGIANSPSSADGTSFEQRYAALAPLIDQTHDLPYIARFALRREWSELSDDQRDRYIDEFTRLSITNYVSRFRNATVDTFAVSGQEELPRGQIEVTGTLAVAGGEKLPVSYILHPSDGSWKIINIIVDGISDLALKRSEYRRVMEDEDFAGLLEYLSSQIADLVALYASD
jgi:phospholipid transport system substrate-binding protein